MLESRPKSDHYVSFLCDTYSRWWKSCLLHKNPLLRCGDDFPECLAGVPRGQRISVGFVSKPFFAEWADVLPFLVEEYIKSRINRHWHFGGHIIRLFMFWLYDSTNMWLTVFGHVLLEFRKIQGAPYIPQRKGKSLRAAASISNKEPELHRATNLWVYALWFHTMCPVHPNSKSWSHPTNRLIVRSRCWNHQLISQSFENFVDVSGSWQASPFVASHSMQAFHRELQQARNSPSLGPDEG